MVLLHAFPLHAGLFDALGELPGYRVITPDLRGFGASPLGDDPPSLGAMAHDVVALMDRLGLSDVLVGGVSMGGYVTMELLRTVPGRLRGVVLIDTKAEADTDQARAGRHAMAADVLRRGREALDPMVPALLGETTRRHRPDVVQTVTSWLDQAEPGAVAWAQRAMADRPDSTSTLMTTRVPGAVLVGEEDELSPVVHAEAMASAWGARPHVVPATGHLAVVEDPVAARRAVLAALAEVDRPV
jgi:pimeloyl-ACP methyl ester carboxylesterase